MSRSISFTIILLAVLCLPYVASAQTGEFTTISQRRPATFGKRLATGPTATADIGAANDPAGAADAYILNGVTTQPNASFVISGNGTAGGTFSANIVKATTQYNIGIYRILAIGNGGSTFAGINAGLVTTGYNNSFFGERSGRENATGRNNSFFGTSAAENNTGGDGNSVFGAFAGFNNTTGVYNSFFGTSAGVQSTTSWRNTFIGSESGFNTTNGSYNTFIGENSGWSNISGNRNTLLGNSANVSSDSLNYATAIGAGSVVSNSNRIVLGRADGSDIVQMPGSVMTEKLGIAFGPTTPLCRNAGNFISTCSSSSLRYKTNVGSFSNGLDLVKRLRPITFDWKEGGMHDLGLGAEDVAAIEPLLVTHNEKGEVEGVKYDRIGVVLINAVKEQQEQIEVQKARINDQQKQLLQQQTMIEMLKITICKIDPKATVCGEAK